MAEEKKEEAKKSTDEKETVIQHIAMTHFKEWMVNMDNPAESIYGCLVTLRALMEMGCTLDKKKFLVLVDGAKRFLDDSVEHFDKTNAAVLKAMEKLKENQTEEVKIDA